MRGGGGGHGGGGGSRGRGGAAVGGGGGGADGGRLGCRGRSRDGAGGGGVGGGGGGGSIMRQQRTTRAQPGNGQLVAAACLRGVVAFVVEPDSGEAEVVDGEQPVAERVGDLFDPAPLRGCVIAGQQFDAATAVEARAYLVVLHLTPLSGMFGSHPACDQTLPGPGRTARCRSIRVLPPLGVPGQPADRGGVGKLKTRTSGRLPLPPAATPPASRTPPAPSGSSARAAPPTRSSPSPVRPAVPRIRPTRAHPTRTPS